jgi:hypothetical protein
METRKTTSFTTEAIRTKSINRFMEITTVDLGYDPVDIINCDIDCDIKGFVSSDRDIKSVDNLAVFLTTANTFEDVNITELFNIHELESFKDELIEEDHKLTRIKGIK